MVSSGLYKYQYINLETFRKNGVGVKTPVWFVEENNCFYVWTVRKSGKAKRIRNNPRVKVAPATARGEILGDWYEGLAEFVDPKEDNRLHSLFKKKYGLILLVFDWMGKIQKADRGHIRIKLDVNG